MLRVGCSTRRLQKFGTQRLLARGTCDGVRSVQVAVFHFAFAVWTWMSTFSPMSKFHPPPIGRSFRVALAQHVIGEI